MDELYRYDFELWKFGEICGRKRSVDRFLGYVNDAASNAEVTET
jgi:hypothetical protein